MAGIQQANWNQEIHSKWIPNSGRSLILIEAVCSERHRQVRLLLDAGVNANCKDPATGHTPLIRAMFIENSKQRRAIIKTLLSYGGQTVKADLEGRTAFSWACLLARNDVLQFLLQEIHHNIALDSIDRFGNTNLSLACTSGNPTTVRLLAEAFQRGRVDLNRRNSNNETALMTAHRLGHYDCVRVLVEEGFVATTLPRDLLYGKRKSSSHLRLQAIDQDSHSLYISLPVIFSVYSDHLTKSFPHSKS